MALTSPQNPLLQRVRRAVSSGRPMPDGSIVAEGPHLLAEALKSLWRTDHIFCSDQAMARHRTLLGEAARRGIEITEVAQRAFKAISDTEQTQGLLCLLHPQTFVWGDLSTAAGPVVILDGIQDPGNAGAIFRSTEAFGGAGVILTEGCVRISNGKFLRAAAGSLFRLPLLEDVCIAEVIRQVTASERAFYCLSANGRLSLGEISLTRPFALVVGNEGAGISAPFLSVAQTLSIPTRAVESLNAAIACSVTLFEATRQRGMPL